MPHRDDKMIILQVTRMEAEDLLEILYRAKEDDLLTHGEQLTARSLESNVYDLLELTKE